jgi:prefoldin beta subunit
MVLDSEISEYQKMEKELQTILLQKYQIEVQLNEIAMALEEIEKVDEKVEIYRAIGSILIRTTVERAREDLKERKALLETRIKVLSQQEEKLRASLSRLTKKLQEELKHEGG